MTVQAKHCRQAKWREGGGSCQPYTWQECTVCYAHEDRPCGLPVEMQDEPIAVIIRKSLPSFMTKIFDRFFKKEKAK